MLWFSAADPPNQDSVELQDRAAPARTSRRLDVEEGQESRGVRERLRSLFCCICCCSPPRRSYEGIKADLQTHDQLLNNIRNLCVHFCRSRADGDLVAQDLTSAAEKSCIERQYSPRGRLLQEISVVNFLVWRRSSSLVLVGLLVILCCLDVVEVHGTFMDRIEYCDKSDFEVNYTSWKEQRLAELPTVSCDDIESDFDSWLNTTVQALSMVERYAPLVDQPARSCEDIVKKGGTNQCAGIVANALPKAVFKNTDASICLNPDICSIELKYWCSKSCGSIQASCSDTRKLTTSLSYAVFAASFFQALLYKGLHQGTIIYIFRAFVALVSRLGVLLLVARSAGLWAQWTRSRKFTFYAAVLLFSIPFLASLIPGSFFIDWDAADTDVEDFLALSRKHYQVSSKAGGLANFTGEVCELTVEELERVRPKVEASITSVCGFLSSLGRKWVPGVGRVGSRLPGVSSKVEEGCKRAQQGAMTTKEYIQTVEGVCDGLDEGVQGTAGQAEDLATSLFDFFHGTQAIKAVAARVYGLQEALKEFSVLWPAAIAMIPGLVQAATMVKHMMPEASIPGLFIVSLPIFHMLLTWCVYNVIVEVAGDGLLLAALLLIVASPLVSSVIASYHHVTAPMDSARAKRMFARSSRASTFLLCVGFACFIVYIILLQRTLAREEAELDDSFIGQAKSKVIAIVIDKFDEPHELAWLIFALVINIQAKTLMTKIASSDWMLSETGEQRAFETVTKNWRDLAARGDLDPTLDSNAAYLLQQKREERLDAIVELIGIKPEDEGWSKYFFGGWM